MQWMNATKWNGRLLAALVAAAVVLAAPLTPLRAQDTPDKPPAEASDKKKAEVYNEKGVQAFFEKKYGQAIVYFQRAHELDPDPVLLYNISLAHSKMGNPADALEAAIEAKKYGGLPEDTAHKNEFRIVAYRRAIKARQTAEAINPPVTVKDEKKDEVPRDEGLSVLGWTGVGTAGVGVAALIGAGVVNFIVAGNLDEYDTARADGDYGRASGLHDDIQSRQEMGRVMLYSGAGLAIVGGALFAYDYFGSPEAPADDEGASVFGTVDSDGASVQLRWNF